MSTAAEPQFHVLAVDDSLTDRKLIERLLRISSCQVTTVDSGSKALEFLGLHEQEIEINLIITDYCMPGMTGYDLLKRIKESESMKDIPVVIMSSEYTPSRINRCLEGGAEEFFMKPVQLSDMKKLRPYLLKGKSRDNKDDLAGRPSQDRSTSDHAELIRSIANSMSSNKRKAMDHEEQQSPDRRRARFSSTDNLTVV